MDEELEVKEQVTNSCDDGELSNEEDDFEDEESEKPKRKRKPGIVYLSSIPTGMNPQIVRDFLGVYGELGKSYLQPVESMCRNMYYFSLL